MFGLREACGICGVHGHPQASYLTYLGLYSLQHRGQESAGIVSSDEGHMRIQKGMGLVADVYHPEDFKRLSGTLAIGHTRYSTAGGSHPENAQPILVSYQHGKLALAHNGNLTNSEQLRAELESKGSIFQTIADSEIIVHLLAKEPEPLVEFALASVLSQVQGAYCLAMVKDGKLFAVRDPYGFRPLVLGRVDDARVVASETCALDLLGAVYEREIEPGEILVIDDKGLRSTKLPAVEHRAHCIFELIYFSRPDSIVFGIPVQEVRHAFGAALARERPVDADMVIAVPDSGNCAALGCSQQSGIPFAFGFTRNHYIGRTFIDPYQSDRDLGVRIKLNPVRQTLNGKRVVVVDDSIVRGTTTKRLISLLRDAGASEVHLRISSPPYQWPCYYGVDTPMRSNLIAAQKDVEGIREFLRADSLGYLSQEGLLAAVRQVKPDIDPNDFCCACFDGKYCAGVCTPTSE